MTSDTGRVVAGNEKRMTPRLATLSTVSIFSSILMRLCTARALLAWARNRSTNCLSRSRSRARFLARPSRMVSSSARWMR
jgi:hypothetical protein